MEVWVRSQDKKFFGKIDNIYFLELDNFVFKKEPNSDKAIRDKKISYRLKCNGADLGEYHTKERCLEIIDEIQKLLCQTLMVVRNLENKPTLEIENIDQSVVVYEMPKE